MLSRNLKGPRQNIEIPSRNQQITTEALEPYFVEFAEDGTWTKPHGLTEEEEPLVLCSRDESTFNANDGRKKAWVDEEKGATIKKKGQGRGIMVSAL